MLTSTYSLLQAELLSLPLPITYTTTYSLLQAELLSLPLPITYTTTYSLQAELLSLREKVGRQDAHAAYLTAENASLRRDKVGSK